MTGRLQDIIETLFGICDVRDLILYFQ